MPEFLCIRETQLLNLLFIVVMLLNLIKNPAFSSEINTTKCIEKERDALLHFQPACANSYAQSSNDCCKWYGVYCSNLTGRIYRLDLFDFLLQTCRTFDQMNTISLSPSLLALEDLNYLDFSNLQDMFPTTKFPGFIWSFPKLRHLDLSFTGFTGVIPPQLGNLTSLRSLEIAQYDIGDGLYAKNLGWLSRLTSLKRLVLRCIDLNRATDWVRVVNDLPSLEYLDMGYSHLPSVTYPFSTINSSKSLTFIDVSNNNLRSSSVWSWIFNHSSLVELYLSGNHLTGSIPNRFRRMTSLSHLDLSFNQLEGGLPTSFEGLCGLLSLSLSHNNLTGELSTNFRSLSCAQKSLIVLSLHANSFSGSVPDFTRFSSLRELNLYKNELDGSLPSSFENPSHLEILNLKDNQLIGSMPDFSGFRSLRKLELKNNRLNGTIHSGLGQLSRLEHLDISLNSLKGEIGSSHLSNLSSLLYLDMSFNSLTFNVGSSWVPPFRLQNIGLASCRLGPRFPEWLRSQKNFSRLDISYAGISDKIPLWLWNLSSVATFIDLSHNQFHGTLPNSSIVFPMNPTIDLSSNFLEGTIPLFLANTLHLNLSRNSFSGPISFLCQRKLYGEPLFGLDLSHNFLSGKLPDCWMKHDIIFLDLSYNNFIGELPRSFGSLQILMSLHLNNNNFSGKLPSFLGNFTDLLDLDLGNNQFFGEMPTWIGDMLSKLTILSLRNNSFSQSIPPNICHLSFLKVLDLSNNLLSGFIPNCVCNLTGMTQKGIPPTVIPDFNGTFSGIESSFKDHVSLVLKGFMYDYENHLTLVKIIDLSSNKLKGYIPEEISCLTGLVSLNLSRNNLVGSITSKIGQLSSLESLDLSRNYLSGQIPPSLSNLNFLGTLNLADNNLSGIIPTGTQIQGFNASVFEGNPRLCGDPLPQKCPRERGKGDGRGEDNHGPKGNNEDESLGLYISIALGFISGFWGVCGVLVFKRSWRYAFFRFWNNVYDRLYLIVIPMMTRIQRRFQV